MRGTQDRKNGKLDWIRNSTFVIRYRCSTRLMQSCFDTVRCKPKNVRTDVTNNRKRYKGN